MRKRIGIICGIMMLCMTPNNPYNSDLYPRSRALSDALLDCMGASTGANRQSVWETDTMSGINHAQVPVPIVEISQQVYDALQS